MGLSTLMGPKVWHEGQLFFHPQMLVACAVWHPWYL